MKERKVLRCSLESFAMLLIVEDSQKWGKSAKRDELQIFIFQAMSELFGSLQILELSSGYALFIARSI